MIMNSYEDILRNSNEAKRKLPLVSEDIRIKAMIKMSEALKANADKILEANRIDL